MRKADAIGYPVLIKASAGGGGKGMRVVASTDGLHCRTRVVPARGQGVVRRRSGTDREVHRAAAPYRDPGLRRQSSATAVYLFERDCSVQRRHQKVIEEAPAPGMTPERAARDGRGGGRRGEGGRLRRCRHGRIHRRSARQLLLHGDEHTAAGRAPGDRDDHRARSGRMATASGRRRTAAVACAQICRNRLRSTATQSSRAFTPRIRTRDSCHRSVASSTCATPAAVAFDGQRRRSVPPAPCGSIPACAPATRSRRTTTR